MTAQPNPTDAIMRATSRPALHDLVDYARCLRDAMRADEGVLMAARNVSECYTWLEDAAADFDRRVDEFKAGPDEPALIVGGTVAG